MKDKTKKLVCRALPTIEGCVSLEIVQSRTCYGLDMTNDEAKRVAQALLAAVHVNERRARPAKVVDPGSNQGMP